MLYNVNWNYIMKLEDFGLNVKKERTKQNISAYELSLRLGKDSSYVSKLEKGKINVSLKMIDNIAQILNIPIENLFKK